MNLEKINQTAKELMANRKAHLEREKGGIYYHGQSTANLVLSLRERILTDDTSHDGILTVAGWFHDCAKGIEPHQEYGALVARNALKELLNENELNKVCSLISLHCLRRPGENNFDDYTKLLQDADLLDHFGVYSIWMNIQYHAHTDGTIDDMISWYKENHSMHVSRYRRLFNYELSKEIYDDRTAFECEYIARLIDESAGKIHNIKKEGESNEA